MLANHKGTRRVTQSLLVNSTGERAPLKEGVFLEGRGGWGGQFDSRDARSWHLQNELGRWKKKRRQKGVRGGTMPHGKK